MKNKPIISQENGETKIDINALLEFTRPKYYRNIHTGIEGQYMRAFYNRWGKALVVKTIEGREYFGPEKEFVEI
ncbi:hypothetical protein [Mesonia aestuariivivens]|uniref:Uncharacterized protein n=1 Tax=Mesonia aestuariivivens TaxID=2796128 RepID=A0ABS6W0A0_9FLAO|nr:hypothetical protein [Mesonia aestuariivivens]MBW2961272.1 hypothetical protein [Mesonia aestuariivivens]